MNPKFRHLLPVLLCTGILIVSVGCWGTVESVSELNAIKVDAYSFYVLDSGPFVTSGPTVQSEKEFLVLKYGNLEMSCGRVIGAFITQGGVEQRIQNFATQLMRHENFLPGCHTWQLEANSITLEGRWFYVTTMLVRRDKEKTDRLSEFQRIARKHEMERFPLNEDRIVKIFYGFKDRDIYVLTLSGPPEDMAAADLEIRKLLANIRFLASEAVSGGITD